MPEKKSSKPSYMQRCVGDLIAQGHDKEAAFAICTSTMQKAGYLTKGPDMEQTKKGANRARHFSNMKDMPEKAAAYEKGIGRKTESVLGGLASTLSGFADSGLTEASIAKMNRRAKAAGAVDSKNPGSKNYSPKEISALKKAVQNDIEDDSSDNFSRVEERKDGVYLVMDCYKNVHPAYREVTDDTVNVTHDDSGKWGEEVQIPEDYFGGFVLEFRVTIGKGGKPQYEFVSGKHDSSSPDKRITKSIVDGAAAALKRGGIDGVREMISYKLNADDLIDLYGEENFNGYESYAAERERKAQTARYEAERKRAAEENKKKFDALPKEEQDRIIERERKLNMIRDYEIGHATYQDGEGGTYKYQDSIRRYESKYTLDQQRQIANAIFVKRTGGSIEDALKKIK